MLKLKKTKSKGDTHVLTLKLKVVAVDHSLSDVCAGCVFKSGALSRLCADAPGCQGSVFKFAEEGA